METEFKGTSGPWSTPTNIKILVVTVGYPSRTICTTGNWQDSTRPFETDFENEANATLIASSPELLEACISALHELQLLIPRIDISVIDRLESAINKALGKQ